MKPNQLYLSVFLNSILFGIVNAVRVQFYQNVNFTGLIYESSSAAKCTNFPQNALIHTKSIKTDTCLWVYNYPNCDSTHWNKKFTKDTAFPIGTIYHLGSFNLCIETKLEPKLNIDITTHYNGTSVDLPVLHRYNGVCSCVNVLKDVEEMPKWSINSNGNDFIGYFEHGCSEHKWMGTLFRASSWKSVNMHEHFKMGNKTKYNIRSFGPILNATYFQTSCNAYYLYSWIMQLETFETLKNSSLQSNSIFTSKSLSRTKGNQKIKQDIGRVVFFSQPHFRGIHLEISSKTGCNNLQEANNRNKITSSIGSLKAFTCIILFSNTECSGRSFKVQAGEVKNLTKMWEFTTTGHQTLLLLYTKFPNWKWNTGSFQTCSENTEGKELNVDITEYYPDYVPFIKPIVYESFKNVCSCQNVPFNVQLMEKWSIDNHENSMIAYFEHDCQSKPLVPLWIPAGRSSYSMGIGALTKLDRNTGIFQTIQSFGPDPDAEYYKLNCFTASSLTSVETTSDVINASVVSSVDTRLQIMENLLENQTKGYGNFLEKFNQIQQQLDILQHSIKEQENIHNKDFTSLADKVTELEKHDIKHNDLLNKVQQLQKSAQTLDRKLENCEKCKIDNFKNIQVNNIKKQYQI